MTLQLMDPLSRPPVKLAPGKSAALVQFLYFICGTSWHLRPRAQDQPAAAVRPEPKRA